MPRPDETPSGAASEDSGLPRYQPLVAVAVAAAVGIAADRTAGDAGWSGSLALVAWIAAGGGLAAWWALWRVGRDAAAAGALLACVALAAACWHDVRWNLFDRYEIGRYAVENSEPVCVAAVVRSGPQNLPTPRHTALRAIPVGPRSRLAVELLAIRDGRAWLPARGMCELTVDGPPLEVAAGDRVQVFGQLRLATPPGNPGQFDYAAYLRADGRRATLRTSWPEAVTRLETVGNGLCPVPCLGADIEPSARNATEGVPYRRIAEFELPDGLGQAASGTQWTMTRWLDAVRAAGRRALEQYVGPDRAPLAAAILLGDREGLPTEETTSFMVTGTVHLLVVSGLHVGILALALYAALRLGLLPRRAGLVLIVAAVAFFALVADARPPVVRAALLVALWCAATWTGRHSIGFNTLACAAVVILALNPADLFRPGPQLSFLCVATLIGVYHRLGTRFLLPSDPLGELIAATRPWHVRSLKWCGRWVAWLLVTTAAVWLVALPLVTYRFHVVTPVAILISPLVWAIVVAALWSGFATLLLGWLPPVAAATGAVCNWSLAGLEGVVDRAATWPAGHFFVPGPEWWWVLGCYAGVALVLRWRRQIAPRWRVALLAAWIVIGVGPSLVAAWSRDRLECSFVSLGHGTCVVLRAPSGEVLLYDAGAIGSPYYATQTVANYLWHEGIWRIDGIVLSHADVDHYNAVPGLLERFAVGAVYVSPLMFDAYGLESPAGPEELRAAIDAAGVPIRQIWAGDRLRVGPRVTLDVLHPPRRGVLGTDNANSVTLAVEFAGRRLLLPGDLETPGLEDLLAERPLDCDVVLAPHHGSRRSDPPGFAAWTTPEWVVVSGGREQDIADVIATYRRAGATLLRTDRDGAVRFALGESGISVRTYLEFGME